MVVEMDQGPSFGAAGPSFGTVAALSLEEPRFAAEYGLADLCSDDGSTAERIAVRCITGPSAKVTELTVAREGEGLVTTTDGAQTRWAPPAGASRCFELHGLDEQRDLEPLRRTWMLDEPKCRRDPSSAQRKVTLQLAPVSAGEGHYDARVTLHGVGTPRGVGEDMTNVSGAVGFRRWPDLNGVTVLASDMGVDLRFAYQLGDRIYYVAKDGRVRAAELPCGARVTFEVRASAPLRVSELD